MPTKTVKQTVTMLNDTEYPVLFGAYKIHEVQMLDEVIDPERLSWVSEGAELHLQGDETAITRKAIRWYRRFPSFHLKSLGAKPTVNCTTVPWMMPISRSQETFPTA